MNRKLSNSLPSLKQRTEYSCPGDLKVQNQNDSFVTSTEHLLPPPTHSKSEYLWENFPNESGDHWQPLSLEENLPVLSPEVSYRYLRKQKSKQPRCSSDVISQTFKAGSGGFRSHEDYNKAVENYSAWWNNMNVKRSTWMSKERFVYCPDQEKARLPDFSKEHERISSHEDSFSSVDDAFTWSAHKNYRTSVTHEECRNSEFPKELHALHNGEAFSNWNQSEKSRFVPGLCENNSTTEVKTKYCPLVNDQYMKVTQGNEGILKTKTVRPDFPREKNLLDRQNPARSSRQSSSESVRRQCPGKCLESRRNQSEMKRKSPRRCNSIAASSKMVNSRQHLSRNNSSNTSKESRSSAKLTRESSESWNMKIGSVHAAPGTARKKWIKTPRREQMSLRKNSACRQTTSANDSDQKSYAASDSSSIRKWRAVLKSAKENGLLKKESSSSSPSKVETVRSLVLPKKLRIFDADHSAEEAENRRNKQQSKSKSQLKSAVHTGSVLMEKLVELQREIASLKLIINSKKSTRTNISIDSLVSNENSSGSHNGSFKPLCVFSEKCSLISAYLPILFSHECYSKKLKEFEEFHRRKLMCAGIEKDASRKIKQCTRPMDGIDGNARSKSAYVVGKSLTDQTASDKSSQQDGKDSSPKLLSYKSVEQIPDSCMKKTPTMEKSTQTELSTPTKNCKASLELRSVGIQSNNEQERKFKEKMVDEDYNKQTVCQFGPESKMGFTFKSTCNVLEIPPSNSEIPSINKSKQREKLKFEIRPTELKKSPSALKRLMSGKVSERVATLEETSNDQKDEETLTKLNNSTSHNFTHKISIEWPTDSLKSPSSRLHDAGVESVDEVDEKVAESPCKGPSKKRSKLMSHSRAESTVESKAENVTQQKNMPNFLGPSCNLGKKSCHRRRFHKSVAKPTPFKLAKSE